MSDATNTVGIDAPLVAAVAALDIVRRLAEGVASSEGLPEGHEDQLHALDWKIREIINNIPAYGIAGLRAKARAVEIELNRDDDASCHGPGSFIALARSLAADVLTAGVVIPY